MQIKYTTRNRENKWWKRYTTKNNKKEIEGQIEEIPKKKEKEKEKMQYIK